MDFFCVRDPCLVFSQRHCFLFRCIRLVLFFSVMRSDETARFVADVCSDIEFAYVDTRLSRQQSVFHKTKGNNAATKSYVC